MSFKFLCQSWLLFVIVLSQVLEVVVAVASLGQVRHAIHLRSAARDEQQLASQRPTTRQAGIELLLVVFESERESLSHPVGRHH